MAIETTPVCEHGIAALTLSAWRDGDLSEAEAAAISAHVGSCAAAQVHLAGYDAIIQALRSQTVPVASERLWRDLETRFGTPQQQGGMVPRAVGRPGATRTGRLVGTLAAVAAALLIVAGFVRVLAPQGRSTSPMTTHPLSPLQLTWAPATLPLGMQFYGVSQVAPAPTNGDVAYGCVSPLDVTGKPAPGATGGATTVWVTSDRAAHWTPAGTLPLVRHDITLCAVLVDDLNPTHLLATATWQRQPGLALDPQQSLAFSSTDGGASWQPLANPQDTQITDFATYGSTTYATFVYSGDGSPQHVLYASDDGMRTWRPIDAQINAADDLAGVLWVRPNTGGLLLQAGNLNAPEGKNITHLWTSDDGGAHWTQLTNVPDASGFVARPSQAGKPWTICGTNFEKTANPNWPGALACSTDGGRTWVQRPLPYSTNGVAAISQPQDGRYFGAQIVGITDSGDIIAQVGLTANTLYRLVPGRSQWQSLGSAPSPYVSVYYVQDSGHGMLWATSGATIPDIATPTATVPIQLFTATYPPEP